MDIVTKNMQLECFDELSAELDQELKNEKSRIINIEKSNFKKQIMEQINKLCGIENEISKEVKDQENSLQNISKIEKHIKQLENQLLYLKQIRKNYE